MEPLIVLSLRGKLEVLRLLFPIDVLLRYLKLVPVLGVAPVDPAGILEALASLLQDCLQANLNVVHNGILPVEVFIYPRLWLRDLLLTTLGTFPDYHLLKILNDLNYALWEQSAN